MATDFRAHGHLWALWDGTPAHAPPGRLTLDDEGRIACHLCGRWFVHLGVHLRRHGWTAARYREAVGLFRHEPLCSRTVSRRIAGRQRERFVSDPALLSALSPGMAMAADGSLARASVDARRSERPGNPDLNRRRAAGLETGRETRRERRARRLEQLVTDAGCRSLADFLHREYCSGAGMDELRALTGLGRDALRDALTAAGVTIRPSGHNEPASRRARARAVDAQVARRLGVEDVRAWLRARRIEGESVANLAERTGRSTAWVRARLDGRTTTARTG